MLNRLSMTAELAARESAPLSHFDRGGLRPHKWDDTEVIPPKALEGDAPSAPNIPARECGHIVFDGKIPVSRIDAWVSGVAVKSLLWGGLVPTRTSAFRAGTFFRIFVTP